MHLNLQKKLVKTKQSVYGQLSGERGISKETAIKYAKKLNVDPADLLFPKQLTNVWGYVNTLEDVDDEDIFSRKNLSI